MEQAKKTVGQVACIAGNVPLSLLCTTTPDDVKDYCKKLIEEIGRGGGFILSSGCSIPANARPENVKALYEAAEEWGYY